MDAANVFLSNFLFRGLFHGPLQTNTDKSFNYKINTCMPMFPYAVNELFDLTDASDGYQYPAEHYLLVLARKLRKFECVWMNWFVK